MHEVNDEWACWLVMAAAFVMLAINAIHSGDLSTAALIDRFCATFEGK